MKKILTLIMSLLIGAGAFAQGIEFFHGTYDQMLQKAQQENKQIFVDVYTSWCGPCKMMARNVFTDVSVGDYYNAHFVCVKLDAEKERDHGFFKFYKAAGYPSFFWLDAQGNLLDTKTGYREPEAFIQCGKEAADSRLQRMLDEGAAGWQSGDRSIELVKSYVLGTLARVHPDQVEPKLLEYLNGLTPEELKSKDAYYVLRCFLRNPKDGLPFQTIVKNADIYAGYEKGYDFWIDMYRMLVRYPLAVRADKTAYDHYMSVFSKTESAHKEMYLAIIDAENKAFDGNYREAVPAMLEIAARYPDHAYLPGEFCYTLIIAKFFMEGTEVSEELKEQVGQLAELSLKNTPCKTTLLYRAAAYAKEGDYRKAYELLTAEGFFPMPMLTNAVYKYLNLPVIHRNYLQ